MATESSRRTSCVRTPEWMKRETLADAAPKTSDPTRGPKALRVSREVPTTVRRMTGAVRATVPVPAVLDPADLDPMVKALAVEGLADPAVADRVRDVGAADVRMVLQRSKDSSRMP
jgi:hypothetical protein